MLHVQARLKSKHMICFVPFHLFLTIVADICQSATALRPPNLVLCATKADAHRDMDTGPLRLSCGV